MNLSPHKPKEVKLSENCNKDNFMAKNESGGRKGVRPLTPGEKALIDANRAKRKNALIEIRARTESEKRNFAKLTPELIKKVHGLKTSMAGRAIAKELNPSLRTVQRIIKGLIS